MCLRKVEVQIHPKISLSINPRSTSPALQLWYRWFKLIEDSRILKKSPESRGSIVSQESIQRRDEIRNT